MMWYDDNAGKWVDDEPWWATPIEFLVMVLDVAWPFFIAYFIYRVWGCR